ncbi:hypothetical protein B8W86_05980 [Lactobacillus kefiranofaciens]|nr:hypothetical protein B8W86_05980 [Lactobacillus kefiranofaciens]
MNNMSLAKEYKINGIHLDFKQTDNNKQITHKKELLAKIRKKQQKNKKTKTGQHLTEDGSKIKKLKRQVEKVQAEKSALLLKNQKQERTIKKLEQQQHQFNKKLAAIKTKKEEKIKQLISRIDVQTAQVEKVKKTSLAC